MLAKDKRHIAARLPRNGHATHDVGVAGLRVVRSRTPFTSRARLHDRPCAERRKSRRTGPTPRRLSPLVIGCLAATWLIWGSTYLAIRFALVGFAPYFMMATRFVCAGALLLAWQVARGAVLPNATEWRNALLVGTLMLGGGMGGVAFAEQTIASGLVVAFIAVIPLLLVLINVAFGVYPRRSELLAVTVGLAGRGRAL